MTELMKTFGNMAKKGRVSTTKEVEKQIFDYVSWKITDKKLQAMLQKEVAKYEEKGVK